MVMHLITQKISITLTSLSVLTEIEKSAKMNITNAEYVLGQLVWEFPMSLASG